MASPSLAAVLAVPTELDDYIAPPLELGAPEGGGNGLWVLGLIGPFFGLVGLYMWWRSRKTGDDRTKLVNRAPPKSTPSVKVHKVGAGNELTVMRGSVHEMAASI